MAGMVDKLSFYRRMTPLMEQEERTIARNGLLGSREDGLSHSLGELLQRVGDTTRDEHYDNGARRSPTSPPVEHHVVLELDDMALHGGMRGRLPPIVLSFTDLTYCVKNPKKVRFWGRHHRSNRLATASPDHTGASPAVAVEDLSKQAKSKILLDSISGEAKVGEILAVLGASGSGKSTLIDALANRIARGSLKGTVTLNGEHLESRLLKAISAYVMQDDLLFPMLTVEETLMFSAEFRLPRALSRSEKKSRVQALIDQLGLRNAAGTIIGDEGHRGVSGGERRRVSIGIDIIHDPILLFLDEPTSGLDSTSAFMVVKVLQRIAQSGSVVVMSVHQPSYRILGLLDRLLFLSRGRTVYSGTPEGLPHFFAEFGHPIPENENRCEFALDFIRDLEGSGPGGTKALVEFNRSWQAMKHTSGGGGGGGNNNKNDKNAFGLSLKEAISASMSRGKLVSGTTHGMKEASSKVGTFLNPFWVEIGVLTKRSFTNTLRTPELFGVRMGAVLITGFILATIFWRLDESPSAVQERLGFFAFAMSTTFYTCADALPVFLHERYIFMRETAYNAYRRSSYVLANSLVSIPSLILLSLAFAAATFFAVGLAGGFPGFLFYFLIIFAAFWAGNSFVTFLSGVVSNVMLGFTIVVAILAYFLLVSGFFISRERIPAYWIWFHYISLVKYPYEAVLHNEFDDPTRCFARGAQVFDNSPLGGVPPELKEKMLTAISNVLMVDITGDTCVTNGPEILRRQGVNEINKWNYLWITIAWGLLFRVLFYFALLLGSKNKRR